MYVLKEVSLELIRFENRSKYKSIKWQLSNISNG